MPGRPIIIVGAGGSGRETLMVLRAVEQHTPGTWDFKGIASDEVLYPDRLERLDVHHLGAPLALTSRLPGAAQWCFVVGVADNQARRAMTDKLVTEGMDPATLIHPSVIVGDDVEIGQGTVIGPNGVITTNVRIGQGVQVNIACVISHDVTIGDYAFLGDSVTLAGDVYVGEGATVYSGARVIPGVHMGAGSVVGAGAVVTRDVPAGVTVVGAPARPLHPR